MAHHSPGQRQRSVSTAALQASWVIMALRAGHGRASRTSARTNHKGKESAHISPLSIYSAPGGLRQDPGRGAEWLAGVRIYGNGVTKCVLLWAHGALSTRQVRRAGAGAFCEQWPQPTSNR